MPGSGVRTGLSFGDALQRLVGAGVIDPGKVADAFKARGGVPDWVMAALAGSSSGIVLSADTAPYLLNLLWPLGLANRMGVNGQSPVRASTEAYASTAGWTLGRADDGTVYFDSIDALPLAPESEATVFDLASKIYRPCCNNSAFFQDCNHGSAMLGMIQLGAASGMLPGAIARLAKVVNGLWYPRQYIEVAVYFDARDGRSWEEADPGLVLGPTFSSSTGWRQMHARLVADDRIAAPQGQPLTNCAI